MTADRDPHHPSYRDAPMRLKDSDDRAGIALTNSVNSCALATRGPRAVLVSRVSRAQSPRGRQRSVLDSTLALCRSVPQRR
jgi:hypothetical protein